MSEIDGFESAIKPLKQEEKNVSPKSRSKSPKKHDTKSERKSVSANQKQRQSSPGRSKLDKSRELSPKRPKTSNQLDNDAVSSHTFNRDRPSKSANLA